MKIKHHVALLCLAVSGASFAQQWPAIAVARNARVFASLGTDRACIEVAAIEGALPYCLAIRHKDPALCKSIEDPLAKVLCQEDAKPK